MSVSRDASEDEGGRRVRTVVARAELVLSRPDRFPLGEVGLSPDPLRELVVAIGSADGEHGDLVEVSVDLLPVKPSERRRWAKQAHRNRAGSRAALLGAGGGFGSMLTGGSDWRTQLLGPSRSHSRVARPTRPAAGVMSVVDRAEAKAVDRKQIGTGAAFWVQLLVRAESRSKGQAEALLQQVLAGLDVFAGENHWRVSGHRIGPLFAGGADSWSKRREFDRRWASGLFRPARRQLVTATELAGLLKPPTVTCPAQFVAQSVGVIPPPPRRLPTWERGGQDLLPLGVVRTGAGERRVAVRLSDTLFSYNAGRSGFGKTETALGQFLAVAHAGAGCLYLDPHGDATELAKQYLGPVAGRVEEIDLAADPSAPQAGWNPIAMEGLGRWDIASKVTAVVDSFSAALHWGEINNRALTLTTIAVQSLCELALQLPADRAPTIFQMTTILSDEDWRATVVPFLSRDIQEFWQHRFPKLSADAITPVTNLIDRLRSSPTVAALLGSSRSTYDVRRSMDDGRIVLWSTAGSGAWSTLVNCFVTYDLFRAAMSRRSIPPAARRPFYACVDELQRISGTGSGTAGESVARAFEEARKMGLRMLVMSQQPTRLAQPTLEAILTNRSHLLSHVVAAKSAKLLAQEWGGQIDPATLTRLPKYHFVAQVMLDGEPTSPFLVRGLSVEDLWGDVRCDDVTAINTAVTANLQRRPVSDILSELDTLNDRIVDYLDSNPPATATSRTGGVTIDDLDVAYPTGRCAGHSIPLDNHSPADSHPTTPADAAEAGAVGTSGEGLVVPFRRSPR